MTLLSAEPDTVETIIRPPLRALGDGFQIRGALSSAPLGLPRFFWFLLRSLPAQQGQENRMRNSLGKILVAAITIGWSTIAVASVDRSSKPGGIYRLKPGIYVQKGVGCGTAPNAAVRSYDGRGISDAHTHSCRARILSRRGAQYDVSQSCVDAGVGPAPRVTERQKLTVLDALTFTLQTRGAGTTYRYCPIYQLPTGLRGQAR
jgi:hypothetical protein